MINQISTTSKYRSLIPFVWPDIPALSVVAGINGSGKTQLLELINDMVNGGGRPAGGAVVPESSDFRNCVKLVRTDHKFEEIIEPNSGGVTSAERVVENLLQYAQRGSTNNKDYNDVLDQLTAQIGKPIAEIETGEFSTLVPHDLTLRVSDYFNNRYITSLFRAYQNSQLAIKNETYRNPISDDEIITRIGAAPPWDVINDLFVRYGFSYRIDEPVIGANYTPQFLDVRETNPPISYSGLSSGEKIIAALVFWGFNSFLGKKNRLFLFDELDSHLNPSLARMMMEIVREKIVGEFGIQVVMTSHSPSTIAYSKDEELFWLERGCPIRKSSRAEIIPILSDGIITVSEEEANLKFSIQLTESEKPALCVEGITDKLILEEAWKRIYPKRNCPFQIFDMFDCHFIINSFKRGAIFENYPEKQFLGLIDFDSAHKDAVEKFTNKTEKAIWKTEKTQSVTAKYFERSDKLGIVTTITVPAHRNDYVYPTLKDGALSIELLFPDSVVGTYCREEPMLGGGALKVFKSEKKLEFARDVVPTCSDADFASFAELFDHLQAMFQKLTSRHN